MLPPDAMMTQRAQALGIHPDNRIIVYDNSPTHSAARGWWMMRVYGLGASAAILDGGLPKWLAEGRPVDSGLPAIPPGNAVARLDRAQVRTKADILANLDSGAVQLVDARGAGRFTGARAKLEPAREPRKSTVEPVTIAVLHFRIDSCAATRLLRSCTR